MVVRSYTDPMPGARSGTGRSSDCEKAFIPFQWPALLAWLLQEVVSIRGVQMIRARV